jgi:uncharacterized membrane protein YphA (DoxX/SURF4 family)
MFVVYTATRLFLAAMLLTSAIPKLFQYLAFRQAIERYELVPRPLVHSVAIAVITLELLTGALLALNLTIGLARALVVALVAIFTTAMITTLTRGKTDVPCGCSFAGSTVSWLKVVVNTCVGAAAMLFLVPSYGSEFSRASGEFAYAIAIAVGLHLMLYVVSAIDQYLTMPSR